MRRALLVAVVLGVPLFLWAALEVMVPDAILAQAGFSPACAVTSIDDDPDSPDADWCTANGNNVDTDVRTSFPTPVDPLTVGADLQEFRWQVRRNSACGSGTPKSRAELWEAGVLVRAGAENNVTSSTGQVFSFTWNGNEVANRADVEARVFNTRTGGSPSVRCSVDVGAVEWNADTTPAATRNRAIVISRLLRNHPEPAEPVISRCPSCEPRP